MKCSLWLSGFPIRNRGCLHRLSMAKLGFTPNGSPFVQGHFFSERHQVGLPSLVQLLHNKSGTIGLLQMLHMCVYIYLLIPTLNKAQDTNNV